MEDKYISYETAQLLNEKGFDIDTWTVYDKDKDVINRGYRLITGDDIAAPTQSLTMRGLMVKHNLFIEIRFDGSDGAYPMFDAYIQNLKDNAKPIPVIGYDRYSYDQVLETAIQFCLKNLISNGRENI